MNTNKPIADSTEIMNRIDRLTSDADWTIEELRESLIADDVDPDAALQNIKMRLAPFIKLKDAPAAAGANQIGEVKTVESLTTFPGIMAAAARLGLSRAQLTARTGLSEPLLIKIDRRLLSLAGFSKIASALANALQTTENMIFDYVGGHSLYPAEANFKADATPELSQKQSFAEAVKNDPILSPAEKERLLAMRD